MSLRSVTSTAPGKCILHGEHAVVHGKQALAAALNLRTQCRLLPASDTLLRLRMPDLSIDVCIDTALLPPSAMVAATLESPPLASEDYVAKLAEIAGAKFENGGLEARGLAVVTFLYLYDAIRHVNRGAENPPQWGLQADVSSTLPIGAGLGSSAAFCVSLAAALLYAFGHVDSALTDQHRQIINSWALHGEKVVHGNPSGLDNTMSVYGGAVTYTAGKFTPLEHFPSLKILLVNTKVPRSTRVLVAGVRTVKLKYPAIIDPVLDSIDQLSAGARARYAELWAAESQQDTAAIARLELELGELVSLNQRLLAVVGVSHPVLEQVVSVAERHGFKAKLTGAGGGGCAMVYLPQSQQLPLDKLQAELNSAGFETWITELSAPGLQLRTD